MATGNDREGNAGVSTNIEGKTAKRSFIRRALRLRVTVPIALLLLLLLLPMIGSAVASGFITSFAGDTNEGANKAAAADGVSPATIDNASNIQDEYQSKSSGHSGYDLPREMVMWIAENAADRLSAMPQVADEVANRLPNTPDRDLRNGAILAEGGYYQLGESSEQKSAQQRTENGYVAALQATVTFQDDEGELRTEPFLDESQAKAAFEQSRTWALGFQPGECAPASKPSTTTSKDDGGVSIEGWGELTPERRTNAIAIIEATNTYLAKLTPEQRAHATQIAVSNAMRESGLVNVGHGDAVGPDSRGLFQQRDSWGPEHKRMDPHWATTKFLSVLVTVPEWDTKPQEEASIDVQVFNRDHIGDQVEMWEPAAAVIQSVSPDVKDFKPLEDFGVYDPKVGADNGKGKQGDSSTAPTSSACAGTAGGATAAVAGQPLDVCGDTYHGPTDRYGPREPICGADGCTNKFHAGIDLAASDGTPLFATADGEITFSGWEGSGGNAVYLTANDGYVYIYYHMLEPSPLKTGTKVKAGQQVGKVGNTGISTGGHLHLGTKNPKGEFVDPETVLAKNHAEFEKIYTERVGCKR